MKSKNTVYMLIICVAIVWGIIFYKIFSSIPEEQEDLSTVRNHKTQYFDLIDHRNDDFDRSANYRDPFSEISAVNPEEQDVIQAAYSGVVTASSLPITPSVNWSGIIYRGYISNPVNKQKVALVSVNGKEAMLSEGDSFSGLKFLKYATDSIKVSYQKSVKYLLLK